MVGSLLLPVAPPFTVRYVFSSLSRTVKDGGRDRPLRRSCFLATGVLLLYAGCLWAQVHYHPFPRIFERWPAGAQKWYDAHWPAALAPARTASDWAVTIAVPVCVAIAGMVLVVRTYRRGGSGSVGSCRR